MATDRHDLLGELFLAASELPDAEREPYLLGRCPDDPDLVREVLGMLRVERDESATFATPSPAPLLGTAGLGRDLVEPPERIGPPRAAGVVPGP